MEEADEPPRGRGFPEGSYTPRTHRYQQRRRSSLIGYTGPVQYLGYPGLLPLPPSLPLPTPPKLTAAPSPPETHGFRADVYLQKPPWLPDEPAPAASSGAHCPSPSIPSFFKEPGPEPRMVPKVEDDGMFLDANSQTLIVARRPDHGGVEGAAIPLIANHFLVRFDPSQHIFHYNIDISPNPSKEIARMIKKKMVESQPGSLPAFDGRRNLYSPVKFPNDRDEFFITLPIPTRKTDSLQEHHQKLFRINTKLASTLDGKELSSYLSREGGEEEWIPLPQDYLQALDVVLREGPTEKFIPAGRSFYSSSMGGSTEIGGGAVGLRGFFQSLRPTQQGLALNVDFSVTAFHESIGVIPYLQKRVGCLRELWRKPASGLTEEERMEVEKALKNIRVFVSHRDTVQRYRVHGLTCKATESLCFENRDGRTMRVVDYFKDQYHYDIQFRNLPCLQMSRSKACYLPMELCVVSEGQKFLGKLSVDQTARILRMGCQRPRARRAIIDGVMSGSTSGSNGNGFKLQISKEMTRLNGRVLQPPKLKLGENGHTRDITPVRHDRQWNLMDSHVVEGTRIERWALLSFGGTSDQRSNIPVFINQLSQRCEQLGIFLAKKTIVRASFEPIQVLNSVSLLESKLRKIFRAASGGLQLLLCLMERKHRGYADLKRITETSIGVISQCCLYSNLDRPSSQFLANLALKINAKVGGSTVALYDSLPSQIPRLLRPDEPVMFMGADVTHPHPLDDSSPSVAALVGSMNWPAANKYVSRMRSQAHRQEIIQDLDAMAAELLLEFRREVAGLPRRIVFFRDGVSETQFRKVLMEELRALRRACSGFPAYRPLITLAVVQKRHHTRFFLDEARLSPAAQFQFSDENIPPGTVVDTVITHPKEFDFYLCSHWGAKGTSRPTHYHVLWDESRFTSDELQRLVHSLCYTFVRCTKPISLVPAVYYAHLAAYRGRLYLERSEPSLGSGRAAATVSRAAPPRTTPLPKLSETVKKLMFYC